MFQRGIQWGINRARTLFSKVIYSFFNRYSRIFLVGNRLCLDEVARPVLARPTITQTSRNSRTQAIIDKLVIAADLVNNMVWSIQALVPTKAVAIHLYGKFSSQFMGKAEREKSIFSAFLSFSFGPNIDFSLSALPINPPKIIFFYTLHSFNIYFRFTRSWQNHFGQCTCRKFRPKAPHNRDQCYGICHIGIWTTKIE